MRRVMLRVTVCVGCALFVPAMALAQGAIGGVVRDSSGGVLPGVTVEASSPALIERVRTAVTDDRGQYLIVNLRPGEYAVTFTLTGFNTLKREGLALSAGVTLPINAELTVGAVQETLTVTGETPVVDVQNTRQRLVLGREVLDAIPRGHQMMYTGALLPGVSIGGASNGALQDQGGSSGEPSASLVAHGGASGDFTQNVDGMRHLDTAGGNSWLITPDSAVQEYVFETSAISAETQSGGVRANIILKDGGNTFKPTFFTNFTNASLTADNLSADLKARGLTTTDRVDKIWDVNPALGGPLVRDRLWFFTTYRHWGAQRFIANSAFESDPTTQGKDIQKTWAVSGRVTAQVTPRNKVSAQIDHQYRYIPYFRLSSLITPEASTNQHGPVWFYLGKWTSPVTNRLLLEFATSYNDFLELFDPSPSSVPGAWAYVETTTGRSTGVDSSNFYYQHAPTKFVNEVGSASYVTGSHAFKFGFQHVHGHRWNNKEGVHDAVLRLSNGVPFQVVLSATPQFPRPHIDHDLGLYAQDQWTLRRVTVNAGLRFDYFRASYEEQNAPAGTYVPARHFDPIADVPNLKDVSPRLGAAYDVFGNGRTAVKASVSRYVASLTSPLAVNPLTAGAGASDTRSWTDRNGDRIPQLDELGPTTNASFGLPVFTVKPDETLRTGWGVRAYNWEYSTSVQQQVLPGLALNVGYFHRRFGNLQWTNNTLIQQSDFAPFTLVSPLSGERITLYNLNPAKRGLVSQLVQFAPDNQQIFDGVDITMTGKFGRGGIVNTGVVMGRTETKSCTVNDPNTLRFCDVKPPFTAGNSYKVIVAYPLPYGIQASGIFQSFPGPQIAANYTVTSAIAGQTLTNSSISVNLVEPGSQYGERSNRLDVRVAKIIKTGQTRIEPIVEVFNVTNGSPALALNSTYGPLYLQPTQTALGRMLKLGVRFDF